ncbi:MAG: helix-turn-helix transcriptional regulator [Oscillospiraceae bacterium]|jgi:transcriptional regulator with XRE-family HTH domain|nr:helix-turn-helix transcriptional regulator [Oscillospiraceae bacterium]
MEFTSRLRGLREDSDMLQNELAAMLNLKPSAISKYEKGLTQPGLPTLIRIADIFKVSVDYLLGVSGVKNPYTQERLSPREAEIISRYRKLSRENQIRIDERLNAMLDFERGLVKRGS